MEKREDIELSRRENLSALLGVLGGAFGVAALSGCANEAAGATREAVGKTSAALTANDIVWVDTVLGVVTPPTMPNARTGDLALNGPDFGPDNSGAGLGGTIAIAKGAINPGDGGGGIFLWVQATATDDGGTIIVPINQPAAPDSSYTPGYWQRIYSGPLNVKWFGAVGDSSASGTDGSVNAPHDDWLAINTAVVAAFQMRIAGGTSSAPGVFFPKGFYSLSQTLEVPGVNLLGEALAILGASPTVSYPLVRISMYGQVIEGLTFHGGYHSIALCGPVGTTNQPIYGPAFAPAGGGGACRIRNCRFYWPKGPAIWQDLRNGSGAYGDSTYERSFQASLFVEGFEFWGAHFFWGCGDWVIFSDGTLNWMTNRGIEMTGSLMLGLLNSSGVLQVHNCFINPLNPWTAPAATRPSIFFGTSTVSFYNCHNGDLTGVVFVRNMSTNKYQGAGTSPQTLPNNGNTMWLLLESTLPIVSTFTNWLEIYEKFPAAISLHLASDPTNDFQSCWGIWVDAGVTDAAILGAHKCGQVVDLPRNFPAGGIAVRRSTNPTVVTGEDISGLLNAYRDGDDDSWAAAGLQANLFPAGIVNDGGMANYSSVPRMGYASTTGYSLPIFTASASNQQIAIVTPTIALAGGEYTYSLYVTASFSGLLQLTCRDLADGSIVNLGVKTFCAATAGNFATDPYQRVSFPFYLRSGASYQLQTNTLSAIPNGGQISLGLWCLTKGRAPAAYTFPTATRSNVANPGRLRGTYYTSVQPDQLGDGGSYNQGDIAWNAAPAAGGAVGWVCVSSGAPGAWKSFGAISS